MTTTITKENPVTDSTPGPDGQHDAHVQVLTAEMRTLMVGSRQVTMSVYNQLDEVDDHTEIEPFGRVCPKDGYYWRTYVVGRDRKNGALVRSHTFSKKGIAQLATRGTVWDGKNLVRPYGWPSDEEDRVALVQLASEWEALPLIVLAGLR
jgi:hypothetical protein